MSGVLHSTEGEREAFEAYARRDGFNVTHRVVDNGMTYLAVATENAWQIWQAARRSMPDTRFAVWCADLLGKYESLGLHLDADKREIFERARSAICAPSEHADAMSMLKKIVNRDWTYIGADADTGNPKSLIRLIRAGREFVAKHERGTHAAPPTPNQGEPS
jgi:hypothetical protein